MTPVGARGDLPEVPPPESATPDARPSRLALLRTILVFGAVAGLATTVLKLIEYRWLVIAHSFEIYGAIVAALFAALGIWLGRRLTRGRTLVEVREVPVEVPVPVPASPFTRDESRVAALGLTPRELEILELMAAGLSTREIAARESVSENTVKTHASRVYAKLGAQRRTQAVQLGRAMRLIP